MKAVRNRLVQPAVVPQAPAPVQTSAIVADKVTAAPKIRCPFCNSDRSRVQTTRGVFRYRECGGCGRSYQSREVLRP